MSCQAKGTPINHIRMVKMEKLRPQELLQQGLERVWGGVVCLFFKLVNYAEHFDSFQSTYALLLTRVKHR